MTGVLAGAAALVALLAAALAVAARAAAARGREAEELRGALESARTELRRLGEYERKKEEARRNAEGKKETLHTGDAAADFAHSLSLLHNASKDGGA
ncbi:MAG: hypothetical protein LBQ35_07040 [Spirochaetaceae bacterium]|nr:hypothetical protein [Spirochaetaceae bacterium]